VLVSLKFLRKERKNNKRMKILIITPTYFPKISGNAICARRISYGLKKLGNNVLVLTSEKIKIKEIKKFNPEVIHALHAYESKIAMYLSKKLQIPYIITLTGSDYEEYLEGFKRKTTLNVMEKSSALVVYNKTTYKNILSKIKKFNKKLFVIGKGEPIIKKGNHNFRYDQNISKDAFVFTLVSGIRPRKNNLFPVNALDSLQNKYPNIILVLVGSVLDKNYDVLLKKNIKGKKWIKYVGTISPNKMGKVYSESDVILNCSHYEGESNAIIEAMYFSKPLLISKVPGNIGLIRNGLSGFYYKNEDQNDFLNKAEKLYKNKKLLNKLSKGAKLAANRIINTDEAKNYQSLYLKVINSY